MWMSFDASLCRHGMASCLSTPHDSRRVNDDWVMSLVTWHVIHVNVIWRILVAWHTRTHTHAWHTRTHTHTHNSSSCHETCLTSHTRIRHVTTHFSLAEYPLFYRALFQKRPIIRSLHTRIRHVTTHSSSYHETWSETWLISVTDEWVMSLINLVSCPPSSM